MSAGIGGAVDDPLERLASLVRAVTVEVHWGPAPICVLRVSPGLRYVASGGEALLFDVSPPNEDVVYALTTALADGGVAERGFEAARRMASWLLRAHLRHVEREYDAALKALEAASGAAPPGARDTRERLAALCEQRAAEHEADARDQGSRGDDGLRREREGRAAEARELARMLREAAEGNEG